MSSGVSVRPKGRRKASKAETWARRAKAVGKGGAALALSSGLVVTCTIPALAAPVDDQGADGSADAVVPHGSLTAPSTRIHLDTSAAAALTMGAVRIRKAQVPKLAHRLHSAAAVSNTAVQSPTDDRDDEEETTQSNDDAPANASAVIATARQYLGVRYVFGGNTPSGWDCSGATRYIFRQIGISLPRTSREQFAATTRISRAQARPGDLVFFAAGGSRITHVGIYAGAGKMYDAGRSGRSYALRAIWTSNVSFGRVLG